MKRFICIVLLLVTAISVTACAENKGVEIPDGMKLIGENNKLFYMFVPSSWMERAGDVPTAYVSSSDTTNVMAVTYMLPADYDAAKEQAEESADEQVNGDTARAAYIDRFFESFSADAEKNYGDNFKLIGEPSDAQRLGGLYSKQYVFEQTTGGVVYRHRMAVTYCQGLGGGLIVYVIYTAKAENYDLYAKNVDDIIREFRFR